MNNVKKYIEGNIGNKFKITTDIEKKRCETITCTIKEAYRSLFVVEVEEGNCSEKLRTYTYSDLYSHQVIIEEVE